MLASPHAPHLTAASSTVRNVTASLHDARASQPRPRTQNTGRVHLFFVAAAGARVEAKCFDSGIGSSSAKASVSPDNSNGSTRCFSHSEQERACAAPPAAQRAAPESLMAAGRTRRRGTRHTSEPAMHDRGSREAYKKTSRARAGPLHSAPRHEQTEGKMLALFAQRPLCTGAPLPCARELRLLCHLCVSWPGPSSC